MNTQFKPEELIISTIAEMLEGLSHVAIGASSPIPGSAALLARAKSGGKLRVSMLGSEENNAFTNGGTELFDCAAQGRIDAFFLGGGQIDGRANINLVGIGDYPRSKARFPRLFWVGPICISWFLGSFFLEKSTHQECWCQKLILLVHRG